MRLREVLQIAVLVWMALLIGVHLLNEHWITSHARVDWMRQVVKPYLCRPNIYEEAALKSE